MTEAKLERRFRSASVDLDRLYSGFYLAELLRELTDENDPNRELFDLACDSLIAIDDGQNTTTRLINFEMRALSLLGHKPMLECCVGCGRTKQDNNLNVCFGLTLGGILCSTCRRGKTSVISLRAASWRYLKSLLENKSNHEFEMIDGHQREVRQFMSQYIAHHLGHRPRMQKYLRTKR